MPTRIFSPPVAATTGVLLATADTAIRAALDRDAAGDLASCPFADTEVPLAAGCLFGT